MDDKKQKKDKTVLSATLMLIFFVLIGAFYTLGMSEYLFASEPTDIVDMIKDDNVETGKYASITIDNTSVMVIDWFAETKHYINGIIPVGKDTHCILYVSTNATNTKGAFISLTVKGNKSINSIDDIIDYMYDSTGDIEKPENITFKGELSEMDSEILSYYKTQCQDFLDVLEEEYEYDFSGDINIYDVTLDSTQTKLGVAMIPIFCLIMVVVCAMSRIKAKKKRKADKLAAYAVPEGTYPTQTGAYPNQTEANTEQAASEAQETTDDTATANSQNDENKY